MQKIDQRDIAQAERFCRESIEAKLPPSPIMGISAYAPIGGAEMASWVMPDGSATPVAVGGRPYVTLTTAGIVVERGMVEEFKGWNLASACDGFLWGFFAYLAKEWKPGVMVHWRVLPHVIEHDGQYSVRARLLIA